jgi:hypothetical protein
LRFEISAVVSRSKQYLSRMSLLFISNLRRLLAFITVLQG